MRHGEDILKKRWMINLKLQQFMTSTLCKKSMTCQDACRTGFGLKSIVGCTKIWKSKVYQSRQWKLGMITISQHLCAHPSPICSSSAQSCHQVILRFQWPAWIDLVIQLAHSQLLIHLATKALFALNRELKKFLRSWKSTTVAKSAYSKLIKLDTISRVRIQKASLMQWKDSLMVSI